MCSQKRTSILKWVFFILCFSLLCTSCKSAQDWMPLVTGKTWRYVAKTPLRSGTYRVRVTGETRVGLVRGYLLASESGNTKMAWSRNSLVVSQIGGIEFYPPLTLLKPLEGKTSWTYTGTIKTPFAEESSRIRISQEPAELTIGGISHPTILVTLTMFFQNQNIEWKTWFAEGRGILRQEQRNNGRFALSLELIRED